MSTEPNPAQDPKRLITFFLISLVLMMGTNLILARLGVLPEPEPEQPDAAAQAEAEAEAKDAAEPTEPEDPALADRDEPGPEADADADAPALEAPKVDEPEPPRVARIDPERLVLGWTDHTNPAGYRLRVEATQNASGIRHISSSVYNAEFEEGKPKDRPLSLVQAPPGETPPLALALLPDATNPHDPDRLENRDRLWSVLVDGAPLEELDTKDRGNARPVRTIVDEQGVEGQELSFQTTLRPDPDGPAVLVTKTYRLMKNRDAVDVDLTFELPEDEPRAAEFVYRLDGPSGIPIEGEWYTYTFRNAYFGKRQGETITVETHSALEVAKNPGEYTNTSLPLAFGGVENQYFATFLKPLAPADPLSEALMTTVQVDPNEQKKADVAVDLVSNPLQLEPGQAATHVYTLYAGAKTDEDLEPFGAQELAIYRQVGRVPIIGFLFDILWAIINPIVAVLSKFVITPLLGGVYALTATISGWFGGARGSYGIAIILLTLVVRMGMFPLSRKQAASAKRMQELQPEMMQLREKYKDDKERMAQETFALYRKYGINPFGGCLPVFIQIPIFMTLWRTLNVSVALRQAEFLWIENLAAPDMLFKLPFTIPFLGPYFNLLPILVIALFFLQMKLFTPPPSSPEQATQQQVMKVMMVFMMLMFYRVPSGLALYFITSSLWSVSERLLLPKSAGALQVKAAKEGGSDGQDRSGSGGGRPGPGGGSPGGKPGPNGGWLSRKLDELMKEAEKAKTYQRELKERSSNGGAAEGGSGPKPGGSPPPRPRPGKKRSRPGKRR